MFRCILSFALLKNSNISDTFPDVHCFATAKSIHNDMTNWGPSDKRKSNLLFLLCFRFYTSNIFFILDKLFTMPTGHGYTTHYIPDNIEFIICSPECEILGFTEMDNIHQFISQQIHKTLTIC